MRNGVVGSVVDHYAPVGVPYFMANNVRQQRLDDSRLVHIDPAFHRKHRISELRAGDVLTVQTGWIGVSCVVPAKYEGANAHALIISRPDPEKVLGDFLCYLLNSSVGRRAIQRVQTGGGRPHLNTTELRKLAFPIPPITLQRRIVAVLSQLDALTDQAARMTAALARQKRGLYQQLLSGRKRFPQYQQRPWQLSALSRHVTRVVRRNGADCSLVLTASGERGLVDQRRYFNRTVAGADLTKYYLLKRGEFAYNRSAMNGYPFGATKRLDEHDEGALSTLYLCFSVSDPQLDSDYLKHIFESGALNRQLRPIARVGARAHGLLNVSDEDFLSISIPLPAIDEQLRIAKVLNASERGLTLLAGLKAKIEVLKHALLTRLLLNEIAIS